MLRKSDGTKLHCALLIPYYSLRITTTRLLLFTSLYREGNDLRENLPEITQAPKSRSEFEPRSSNFNFIVYSCMPQ